MTHSEWAERVAEAELWFLYHIGNYERGKEVGASEEGQERRVAEAARWASILTALKGMEPSE